MRKSYFYAVIAAMLAIAVIFSSCGGKSDNNASTQAVTSPHDSNMNYRVAILQYDNDYCSSQMRQAFIARMRTLGYDEAKMKFDILSSQGNAQTLSENAESLVNSEYSLIVALGTLAAKAVAATENKIPCVFIGAQDPVGNGLVTELTAPDKNMTGTAFRSSYDTLFAIMRVYTPNLKNIALLSFEGNAFNKADTDSFKATLQEGAYGVESYEFKSGDDIGAIISDLCQRVDAFYLPADDSFEKSFADIVRIAGANGKYVFTTSETAVSEGALLGAFTSAEALAQNAALMADRIMQGEEIAKIPVDVEIAASLFVSRQAANQFSVEIPKSDNLVVL